MSSESSIKKKPLILLGVCLCLFLTIVVKAQSVESSGFYVYVVPPGEIGFQNTVEHYVLVTVLTGELNATTTVLKMHLGGGYFKWDNLNTTTFTIDYTVDTVKVAGDNDNELRSIVSGSEFTGNVGNYIQIIWSYRSGWWLPILFMFGMIGIASTFGGLLWSVSLMKQGEYRKAFREGVLFIAVGLALVIAWLWGGG